MKIFLNGILVLLLSSPVLAQVYTPGHYQSYLRDFEILSGQDTSFLMLQYALESANSKFQVLDPITQLSVNTGYPRGYRDGAVWKGKGLNAEAHIGVQGSLGWLKYTFQPVIYFAQNQSFELAENRSSNHVFNYQFTNQRIDWVQKYGEDAIAVLHPGQSEVKLSIPFNRGNLQVAVGTQNINYGPFRFNPIVMSSEAAGIPKANLGTDGPIDLGYKDFSLGKFELNLIYGWMQESEYYDEKAWNDTRYFNALFVGFSPSFAPNLTLGFNKVLYKNNEFFEAKDLFSTIVIKDDGVVGDSINAGNDTFDQLASLSAEWKFPEVGFRVYGEYARNDFNGDLRRLMVEPEHSRGYAVGFQKLFEGEKNDVIITYEHTNLSRNLTYQYRASPTFYAHHVNRQGYTNNGQLMGAGIGPGANADNFEVKIKSNTGGSILGFLAQRIEFNKDYFITSNPDFDKHDIEYTLGSRYFLVSDRVVWGLEANYSYNFNRYYITKNDLANLYLGVSAQVRL